VGLRSAHGFGAFSLLLLSGMPSIARAGPFPPIAVADVSPAEPAVGETVEFSSVGTFDPDDATDALTYEWDFDDGSTGTGPMPTHAYASAGAYRARLVVSDGTNRTEAGVTVFVLPVPAARADWSSALLLLEALGELWVLDADGGRIVVLDLETHAVTTEIPVCAEPSTLGRSAAEVLVGCAATGEIVALDPVTHEIRTRLRVGVRVQGLVTLLDDRVLVALPSENAVVLLAPDLSELSRISVAEPRAVARDGAGSFGYAASFLSLGTASVTRIDLRSGASSAMALAMDPGPDTPSSSRGLPNLLGALAIDPSGETLWIGGLKSNGERGLS
jgi:hypothetical protein